MADTAMSGMRERPKFHLVEDGDSAPKPELQTQGTGQPPRKPPAAPPAAAVPNPEFPRRSNLQQIVARMQERNPAPQEPVVAAPTLEGRIKQLEGENAQLMAAMYWLQEELKDLRSKK